jgi:hypothetical protein
MLKYIGHRNSDGTGSVHVDTAAIVAVIQEAYHVEVILATPTTHITVQVKNSIDEVLDFIGQV